MSVSVQSASILRPQTFDQLHTFAQMAAKSSLVPKDYTNRPENIMLAVQMGSELGLAPMQSLQNIAVINGRPSVWGDAMLALVKVHPEFEDCQETTEGDGDKMTARCMIKRRGQSPVIAAFSADDAKKAGLWGKAGPWQSYPKRMLQMRARGFAVRDAFPDALRGLISAEEAGDIGAEPPRDSYRGPTIDATAEPSTFTPEPEKSLAERASAATEIILTMPHTMAAHEKLEKKLRPLLEALDATNETEMRSQLVQMLAEHHAAIDKAI